MTEHNQQQHPENIISGRRSFDRQFDLLAIGVHTLQRDFKALEERARATQESVDQVGKSMDKLKEDMHDMDKLLVAKVATITVTERALWALGSAILASLAASF